MILREGRESHDTWFSERSYKYSMYNIVSLRDDNIAVYNAASGALAVLPRLAYENMEFNQDDMFQLVKNGFCVPESFDEFMEYCKHINFASKKKSNFFTIIPTTACNAKCFYCYEEDYCKKTINDEAHESIVTYITNQIQDSDTFTLDWYGGEPLLCVDEIDSMIKDIATRVDLSKKTWTSSITTNATLFDSELISHAVRDWHLTIAYITIDGVEEDHNNRKNVSLKTQENAFIRTYAAIKGLLDEGVFVNLRIHLDNENKASFKEIVESIKTFLSYDNFQLFPTYLFPPEYSMPERYISDEDKEDLFYQVYKELVDNFQYTSVIDAFPWPKIKNCFATRPNTVVIGPDATLHTCVQEFTSAGSVNDKKFTDYSQYCFECKECVFFPICLSGCIHNRSLENTVRTPCVRNRFIVRPLLQLLLEKLEEKQVR